jgi:hypothetical protein
MAERIFSDHLASCYGGILSYAGHPGAKPRAEEERNSAAVIEKMGLSESFTHISTGGGTCIEFLTGKKLPAIEALKLSKKKFG